MIVQEQPQPDQPGRTQTLVVRQHEAHRPGDVRGHAQQHLALDQRLAHQPEFVIFQIAQPAMDQLGAGRGGGAGKVLLLAQEDGKRRAGGITGNAAAIHAAADDGDIENLAHGR